LSGRGRHGTSLLALKKEEESTTQGYKKNCSGALEIKPSTASVRPGKITSLPEEKGRTPIHL